MRVQTQADSARILNYEIEVGGSSRQLLSPLATIYNGTDYLISINEVFQNLKPWNSKPRVRVALLLRSYLNKKDSLRTFELVKSQPVQWDSSVEPGLKKVSVAANQLITNGLVWSKDNEGFFFHVNSLNQGTSIQYYRLWDSSIVSVTPPTAYFRALHIANNNQSLLVTDVGTRPSNLYVLTRSTGAQRLIWEARDSIQVTSARYSTSDYRIAFTGTRLPAGSEHPVYLMDLRDSSVVRLELPSRYRSQQITSWLTASNDKFVFHAQASALHIYSIGVQSLSTVTFPEPFRPRFLLPDGFGVLGIRIEEADTEARESHLWLYDISQVPVRQLTFLPEVVSDFELSPNGRILAFTSQRGGTLQLFILTVSNILEKR